MNNSMLGKKILIVDHDVEQRLLLEGILKSIDPEIRADWVASPWEGRTILRGDRAYDMIISEYVFSGAVTGLDLWEYCRLVRPRTPFVLLSDMPTDTAAALARLCEEDPKIVKKPLDPREVTRTIRRSLGVNED